MPLIRIDMIEGRSDAELQKLLDAAHKAMVEAFKVPVRDRYQIVHEHPKSRMIIEDTGLDIPRTDDVIVVQVTTRPRSVEMKQAFYELLVKFLEEDCGIKPSDVMVSMVTNSDEDWSFGFGRGQFLTGEL